MNIIFQECAMYSICDIRSINNPNIDTFGTIAIYVVTIVGTPSYTSGDQKWKGAALTLNKNPTRNTMSPKFIKKGLYQTNPSSAIK